MKKILLFTALLLILAQSSYCQCLPNISFTPWVLNGNSGTTSTNYLGTCDGKSLRFGINEGTGTPTGGAGIIDYFYQNTSLGIGTLVNIWNGTGSETNNTAMGYEALTANTTGSNNTAIGYQALFSNQTIGNLTAIGYQSLYLNTSGIQNVATGYLSLSSNTQGSYNTANGFQALGSNIMG